MPHGMALTGGKVEKCKYIKMPNIYGSFERKNHFVFTYGCVHAVLQIVTLTS